MSDRVQFIESLDDILNQFEYNSKQILHFEKLNLELLEKHNNLTQLKPNL